MIQIYTLGVVFCTIQKVCYQYWPTSGSEEFDELTVELLCEEILQGFVLRTFNIEHSAVSPHIM